MNNSLINVAVEENKTTVDRLGHLKLTVQKLVTANIDQENLACELNDRLKESIQEFVQFKEEVDRCRQFLARCHLRNPKLCSLIRRDLLPLDVIKHLREFTQELISCTEVQEMKLKDLEKQRISDLAKNQEETEKLKRECADRLQQQRERFDEEMANTLSRVGSATSEARALTLQATNMRSSLEEKLRCKTQVINQLKDEIRLLIEGSQNNNHSECEEALKKALDKAEQDVIKVRCERDSKVVQNTILSAKLEAAEAHVKEVDKQCVQLNSLNHLLKQQHSRLKSDFDKTKAEKVKLSKAILRLLIKMSKTSNYAKCLPTNLNKVICRANKNVEKLYGFIKAILNSSHFDEKSFNSGGCPHDCKEVFVSMSILRDELDRKEKAVRSHRQSVDQQQIDLECVKAERDYYLQILTEQGEELCTAKAEFQRQSKELQKLKRAQTRMDELAFQVELLKSNPATFNVGREKQKSLPAEYAAGKQIYRVDPLQKVINIDTTPRRKFCEKANRESGLKTKEIVQRTEDAANELNLISCTNDVARAPNSRSRPGEISTEAIDKQWTQPSVKLTAPSFVSSDVMPLNKLQGRLNHLEQRMLSAANEKQSMQEENQRMAGSLRTLMEQNRKLRKGLRPQTDGSPEAVTSRVFDSYIPKCLPDETYASKLFSSQALVPKRRGEFDVPHSMQRNLRSPAASPDSFESRDFVYASAYNTSNDNILRSKNMVANLHSDLLQSDDGSQRNTPTLRAQTELLIFSGGYNVNNQSYQSTPTEVECRQPFVQYSDNKEPTRNLQAQYPWGKLLVPGIYRTAFNYRDRLHFDYRKGKVENQMGIKDADSSSDIDPISVKPNGFSKSSGNKLSPANQSNHSTHQISGTSGFKLLSTGTGAEQGLSGESIGIAVAGHSRQSELDGSS